MRLEKFFIDEKKPVHVSWWAEQFNVSEEALLQAIAAVGNRADDVRNYFDKQERRIASRPFPLTVG